MRIFIMLLRINYFIFLLTQTVFAEDKVFCPEKNKKSPIIAYGGSTLYLGDNKLAILAPDEEHADKTNWYTILHFELGDASNVNLACHYQDGSELIFKLPPTTTICRNDPHGMKCQ